MPRRGSEPFRLIQCFARVWSQEYDGETYEVSGKDYKQAQIYLDLNDNTFSPDNIVAKARIYLSKGGIYAENRHGFSAFVNNIGSFVEAKREKREVKVERKLSNVQYYCGKCERNHRADEICPKEITA